MKISTCDMDSACNYRMRTGTASTFVVIPITLICGMALLIGLIVANLSRPATSLTPGQRSNEPNASAAGNGTIELKLTTSSERSPDTRQGHLFEVLIRKPEGPPRVFTGINDIHGNAVTVSCSTCHSGRQPNFENKTLADMDEFHGYLEFSHGSISCLSCHNSTDYDALQLADGTRIHFSDVMTLCAQCHGPQMRDFQHNAHGGYTGHWDLSRGSQTKNNCVDCHHPHAPQFPRMQPTFKPKDRFLEKPEASDH